MFPSGYAQIATKADQIQHAGQHLADSIKDSASNILEKSSEFVKEKADQVFPFSFHEVLIHRDLPSWQIKSHLPNVRRVPPSKTAQVKQVLTDTAEKVRAIRSQFDRCTAMFLLGERVGRCWMEVAEEEEKTEDIDGESER